MKHTVRMGLLVLIFILVGCNELPVTPVPTPIAGVAVTAVQPTTTLQPTPTLAQGALPEPRTPIPVTPTITPTPSPTPLPEQRVQLALTAVPNGNRSQAVTEFEAAIAAGLADPMKQEALYTLGVLHVGEGRFKDALALFAQLEPSTRPAATDYYEGRAYEGLGDYRQAIVAYERYMQANPETAAYIQPSIGLNQLALGDRAAAIVAYETAVSTPAHRLTLVGLYRQLAAWAKEDGDVAAMVAHYDAIHEIAITEFTRGEMTYLAGKAQLDAGNSTAAYTRFQKGITDYPRAYESYLGLSALVDAGQPVDEFQRGLVDYYAAIYEPAIGAFNRVIAADPAGYRPDTHLYLAWSYEGLGDLDAARDQLEKYGAVQPARALIEQAHMEARAGQQAAAIANYQAYATIFPAGVDAPLAIWRAAVLSDWSDDWETAVSLYEMVAISYPGSENAPEALFRAGWLAEQRLGDPERAGELWQRAAQTYPRQEFGAAALVWLLRTLPTGPPLPGMTEAVTNSVGITDTLSLATPTTVTGTISSVEEGPGETSLTRSEAVQLADGLDSTFYYALRAQDVAAERPPFARTTTMTFPETGDDQAATEAWLTEWLGLDEETAVSGLSPDLATDPRLLLGQKLWDIGLYESAKLELEALRAEKSSEALASYQLALFFRDLGLYRSSIIAASSVIQLSGQTVFAVPVFLARLAYPTYYADLILPLAEQYGFDPLLQFALVRQESLFESFARSGAAAQGLSQVIPDTGAYIARRLNWPDFTNEDLYEPYVGLAFGAYYLDQQLDYFDGDVHAALSAYNAGPGNAARWHELAGSDIDIYLETVDFSETRLYIERIYSGYTIYRHLYAGNRE